MTSEMESQAIPVAAQQVPYALRHVWDLFRSHMKKVDFEKSGKRYQEHIVTDYGYMQILGMEKPVPIQQIYTEVRIATRVACRSLRSREELLQEARTHVNERHRDHLREHIKHKLIQELRRAEIESKIADIETQYAPRLSTIQGDIEDARAQARAERGFSREKCKSADGRDVYDGRNGGRDGGDSGDGRIVKSTITGLKKELRDITASRDRAIELSKHEILTRVTTPTEDEFITQRLPRDLESEIDRYTRRKLHKLIRRSFFEELKHTGTEENAWDAVISRPRTLILGRPGAGKTTFLKHILLRTVLARGGEGRLSMFISLRTFAESRTSLTEHITREFEMCGFSGESAFASRMLEKKRTCIVLLDGLDEVPLEHQDAVVDEINRFSRQFRNAQLSVSCRTANYRGRLSGFTELEIVDFNAEQVAKFVDGWFVTDRSQAHDFMLELRRKNHLEDLTTTPLLLAILCITYSRNLKFPDQRAALYKMCVDALLIEWDSSRQIRRNSFVASMDVETKQQIVARVACDTFSGDKYYIEHQELIQMFETVTEDFGVEHVTGGALLDELVQNHGILVERAKLVYTFSHLTFHEFFTALYLSRRSNDSIIKALFREVWSNPKWNEVAVFFGTLLGDANALVTRWLRMAKHKLGISKEAQQLLGFELPSECAQFVARSDIRGDLDGWECFFRTSKILHMYQLCGHFHSDTDDDGSGVFDRIVLLTIRAGRLVYVTENRASSDMRFWKPLNRVMAAIRGSTTGKEISLLESESVRAAFSSYMRICELLLSMVAEKARVAPEIRRWVFREICEARGSQPPSITRHRSSKFGV